MDEFNYKRNILNAPEAWMKVKLIPRPLRLTPYTHRMFCRFGVTPYCTEHVVGYHKTKTHTVFIIRETNLKRLLPPNFGTEPNGGWD